MRKQMKAIGCTLAAVIFLAAAHCRAEKDESPEPLGILFVLVSNQVGFLKSCNGVTNRSNCENYFLTRVSSVSCASDVTDQSTPCPQESSLGVCVRDQGGGRHTDTVYYSVGNQPFTLGSAQTDCSTRGGTFTSPYTVPSI